MSLSGLDVVFIIFSTVEFNGWTMKIIKVNMECASNTAFAFGKNVLFEAENKKCSLVVYHRQNRTTFRN
jgi:hypothetical protein